MFTQNAQLAEYVYGGIDGIITTFAIMTGALGAGLSPQAIIILGVSNVIADGYSMAISRYEAVTTEISQGYMKDKNPTKAATATFLSFVLFGLAPIIPFIAALFIPSLSRSSSPSIALSIVIAAISLFTIGYIKDDPKTTHRTPITSGLQTLMLGLSAALISYTIAHLLANKLIKKFA